MSTLKKSQILPWVALVVVWIAWGSTYLGIRTAVETIPPLLMAGFRFLSAGTLMLAIIGPRQARGANRPTWRHLRSAFALAALLLVGGNGLLSYGEQYLNSGLAAMVVATVPVWMVLINALATRTPVSGRVIAALVLGTAGVGVLLGGPGSSVHLGGAVIVLISSVFWAGGSVYARSAPLPTNPAVVTSLEMIAGGLLLIIAGAVTGEFGRLQLSEVSRSSLLGLLWLIFAGSILGFTAYVYANSTLPNDTVATHAYVNPVVAVIIGSLLGQEAITANLLLGGLIIVASVVVIVTGKPTQPAHHPLLPPPVDHRPARFAPSTDVATAGEAHDQK